MNNHKKNNFEYDKRGQDQASLRLSICNRPIYSLRKDSITATCHDWFLITVAAVHERLMERWMETMRSYYESDANAFFICPWSS